MCQKISPEKGHIDSVKSNPSLSGRRECNTESDLSETKAGISRVEALQRGGEGSNGQRGGGEHREGSNGLRTSAGHDEHQSKLLRTPSKEVSIL